MNPQRVEVFLNSLDPENIAKAERVAINTITTLPHTPFGGYGINFKFQESEPEGSLLDDLMVKDKLNLSYKTVSHSFASQIMLDDTILNLTRQIDASGTVIFDFNFHYEKLNVDTITEDIQGKYTTCLQKATTILSDIYHIEGYDLLDFNAEL